MWTRDYPVRLLPTYLAKERHLSSLISPREDAIRFHRGDSGSLAGPAKACSRLAGVRWSSTLSSLWLYGSVVYHTGLTSYLTPVGVMPPSLLTVVAATHEPQLNSRAHRENGAISISVRTRDQGE